MVKEKESFQKQVFSLIKKYVWNNNMITIPETFIKFYGDLETAVFLSQLLYWCDKGKSPDGFIYKSDKEWYEEISLSEYYIRKCAKKLKKMGILETKKKMANGSNTWHYKLDRKAFLEEFLNFLRKESKNLKKRNLNSSDSITEPTTQPTTEITLKNIREVNSKEIHSFPTSFKEYKENYPVDEETTKSIEYFLEAYEIHMGERHPKLKPEQWKRVVDSLLFCEDTTCKNPVFKNTELSKIDLDFEKIQIIIDKYFKTKFRDGCNYSILHFNSDSVKTHRFYEELY